MTLNLHEINKHLRTHAVSADEFEEMLLNNPKMTTKRKPKKKRERYEDWKLREETRQIQLLD